MDDVLAVMATGEVVTSSRSSKPHRSPKTTTKVRGTVNGRTLIVVYIDMDAPADVRYVKTAYDPEAER
jgi:hypothetical protein